MHDDATVTANILVGQLQPCGSSLGMDMAGTLPGSLDSSAPAANVMDLGHCAAGDCGPSLHSFSTGSQCFCWIWRHGSGAAAAAGDPAWRDFLL